MDEQELIGMTLGTCTIERVIGRGGMGTVYMAQQSRPVRTVAVKVLMPPANASPDQQRVFMARFRREADTVAKLEHKNILEIFEYAEAIINSQPIAYLVMPFIRGGTLRERMDDMRRNGDYFDLAQVVNYIDQIASALSYAHSLGVVHRDIKPANLLFHQDGRMLLTDFGIARLSAMPSLTMAGSFMGTAEYASPEQVHTSEVDFRSDIYSLGIMLYELLTNTVPFTGPHAFAIMSQHLSSPVPPIDALRPGLPVAVEAVVMKALAKKPTDRYQSAVDLAADLRSAIAVPTRTSAAQGLRLNGDAGADDNLSTMADHPWQWSKSASNLAQSAPTVQPVQPAQPVPPLQPMQQSLQPSPWDDVTESSLTPTHPAVQYPYLPPLPNGNGNNATPDIQDFATGNLAQAPAQPFNGQAQAAAGTPAAPSAPVLRNGRRLFYYGTALIGLVAQALVFLLLMGSNALGGAAPALGVLAGSSVNLLILAAIGFTGVTRNRSITKYIYRVLIGTVLALLVSSAFINFGGSASGAHPLLAYIVLVLSNIFAVRQLALVDAKGEQVEVAPTHWRGAIVGALTGLLPLTIILLFALAASPGHSVQNQPLLRLYGILAIALIGAPTPGAMMAVWLSQKMSKASLVRSSAIAGLLLFVGAFLLVVLLGLLPTSSGLFFYHFGQPLLTALLLTAFLGLLGGLRAMLDAWVYWKIAGKKRV